MKSTKQLQLIDKFSADPTGRKLDISSTDKKLMIDSSATTTTPTTFIAIDLDESQVVELANLLLEALGSTARFKPVEVKPQYELKLNG